jgi:hypothetical protein
MSPTPSKKELTYCFKIAIPSPILENRQFHLFFVAKATNSFFGYGSGKGFFDYGVFPAQLAYSK